MTTPSQVVSVAVEGRRQRVDLAQGRSLALRQRFDGTQPRWFGTPPAHAAPVGLPGFSGAVATGASCNCQMLHFTPHCDGTHTETTGHLTRAPWHLIDVAPREWLPALLLSVRPEPAAQCGESSEPQPQPGDLLISRRSLATIWPARGPFRPRALVIRTLPNDSSKLQRDYRRQPAAYLSREAAEEIVARGIEHLVLDVPSADRADDGGRLCAHHLFFGLPPGSVALRDAQRPHATITELAFVDAALADGYYLLMLQLPDWQGDALPCRPMLYPLLSR